MFVDLFCLSDSTCKGNHMVFVFLCLISFSIMPSRSIHIVANAKILLFIMANMYIHTHIYHIFFIHSPIDGHLGCFQVLAILHKAVMNIEVHISFQISVFVFFQ